MSDSHVRPEAVDVEQIMRQIRARVREKHGATYTEAELQQLAAARLDGYLDPRGQHAELVAELKRRATPGSITDFSEEALYASHNGLTRFLRKLLNPLLKLFINPSAFSRAMQARQEIDGLIYDVMQQLVTEQTRLHLEVNNLKMRVESLSTRLEFDARRSKALEHMPPSRPIQQDRDRDRDRDRQRQQHRGPVAASPSPLPQITQSPAPPSQTSPVGGAQPQSFGQAPSTGAEHGGQVPGGPGGEPRRRRRRRRRRRSGQGPHGQAQPGQQGFQGSQGQQGSQGPQESSPQEPGGAPTDAGDAGGDEDWDVADDGAADQ